LTSISFLITSRGPFLRLENWATFCPAALEAGNAEIVAEVRAASVPSGVRP
jgi:hypothetical protein